MSIVKLSVTRSRDTFVDDDIAEKLKGKKLFGVDQRRYVGFVSKGKMFRLHRFVMDNPEGMEVDHINGDKYDNTRENLRVCTSSENSLNIRTDSTALSGYRNVAKYTKFDRYFIQMRVNKKSMYFFTLRSRHIAGIFADQILVRIVGPFVKKNFTEKISSCCLVDFLEGTRGRIFRVVFSRRSDGRQREMVCRTGVNSKHNNGTIPFEPSSMNLFSVYDVQKRAYRFIPLENVICIRFAKKNYRVVA